MSKKLTRAEHIALVMARMGFRIHQVGDAHHVEYVKDYAESNGKMARLRVLFTKSGFMGVMDQARLSQFIVTVQGAIDPIIEEVKDKAPRGLQADMLHALEELEGLRERPVEIPTATCSLCEIELTEWIVDDQGRIHCPRPEICEFNEQ